MRLAILWIPLTLVSGFPLAQVPPYKKTRTTHVLSSAMDTPAPQTTTDGGCIRNFRQAAGLVNIYRCGKPETLADLSENDSLSYSEDIVLNQAGLILDLRSDSERDNNKIQKWTSRATGSIETQSAVYSYFSGRTILQLDPLSPAAFMLYLEQNWMSSAEKIQAGLFKLVSGDKLHTLRMKVLNQKELSGLNEAILETGCKDLSQALKAIILNLEKRPETPIVVHCAQGKDRTGLVTMLCQAIIGCSDETIIEDYHRSEICLASEASAIVQPSQPGKVDRKFFRGAPRKVMKTTLDYLRQKYGSIDLYLDKIGVDEGWRQRFREACPSAPSSSKL